MTVSEGQRHLACSANHREAMEVEDSPLNLKNISQPITLQAHQQCRKAERLLVAGKYEEAISCHEKAAELLTEAMKTTECKQARLSMELQRDSLIKQQRLIQERLKRETRREATKSRLAQVQPPPASSPAPPTQPVGQPPPSAPPGPPAAEGLREREYDTLLYQLQTRQAPQPLTAPCPGTKTTKDDRTRLEEQQTTIEDLRRLVTRLMDENQALRSENARLRSEAADADFVECSELWGGPQGGGAPREGGLWGGSQGGGALGTGADAIPPLPPLEMPAHEDLCLDHLPPLELPEDIQNTLQELLDRDKL